MIADDRMAYVGRQECGCIIAATVDNPAHKNHVANDLAEWVRDGLTIERLTLEEAREQFGCKCVEQLELDGMPDA